MPPLPYGPRHVGLRQRPATRHVDAFGGGIRGTENRGGMPQTAGRMIPPRNKSQSRYQRERIPNGIGNKGALSQMAQGQLMVAIGCGRTADAKQAAGDAAPVADAAEPVEEPDELRSSRCVA